MANTNRDFLMTVDVKTSKVSGGGFSFFVTDKHTSNFFVRLVMSMSANQLISEYVTLEEAKDYKIELFVVKPNNELKNAYGVLMNDQNALFQFDLKEDFKDLVGTYNCEFHITAKVTNSLTGEEREETITTDPFKYTVKPSILNDIGQPSDAQGQPVIMTYNEDGNLEITINGETKIFNPIG